MTPVARAQVADPSKKAEALKHFEIGLELTKQEAWDSALAEFLRSRELFPTKNALKNAVLCLRELKRFDEALDMYDELVARFGSELSPTEKTTIEEEQKALEKFVGTITLETATQGARVVIDGRDRGVTPLAKPIRVTVGTRAIVVSKQGFAPYETKVMVSSGEAKTVTVKLVSVANAGKLKVTEAKGRVFDVVVDGAVVGKTPWEGALTAGTHTVALRGPSDEGTLAKPVEIVTDKSTELSLEATKLPGELRVDPIPATADILVDGKKVGGGPYRGELATGVHVVTVSAPWHRDQTVTVTIVPGRTEAITPALDRIARLYIEAQPMVNPLSKPGGTFSGKGGGEGGLDGLLGLTLRVGVRLHPHFAVEVGGGFLSWGDRRSPNGVVATNPDVPGSSVTGNVIDEEVRYEGGTLLVSASTHFGDSFPIVLRAISGLWFPKAKATGGQLTSTDLGGTFPDASQDAFCVVAGPEARFGVRFTRTFTLDLGIVALFARCGGHDFGPRRVPSGVGLPALTINANGVLWAPTLGFRWEL